MINQVVINGENITSLASFYDEIESKLTKGLSWKIGRNFNAFNDVLRGGFGIHEYEEPIKIIWKNSSNSRESLAWDETIKCMKAKLNNCHPSNIQLVKEDLKFAIQHKGQTLFEMIIDIIKDHSYINLELT